MGLTQTMPVAVGSLKKGKRNLITDVEGVLVGHCTLSQGEQQTGVTAVLPHTGDIFHDKVMAAVQVFNGFGKTMGLVQLEEMGSIEAPILLTNTLSAGVVYDAVVRIMLEQNEDIGNTTGTVNPIVCECNDGEINQIRGLFVTEDHARQALANCGQEFAEGAVGAGRGMLCHQCKGGIGSASRVIELDGREYTVGALVLTNHGKLRDLTVEGRPVGEAYLASIEDREDKGSCIMLLATDIPLSERQLRRMCRRAVIGLHRLGSYMGNGSGELCIGFTTANRLPHYSQRDVLPLGMLHDDKMNLVFRAAAEAVEESVLSSLLHSQGMADRHGKWVPSLADILTKRSR